MRFRGLAGMGCVAVLVAAMVGAPAAWAQATAAAPTVGGVVPGVVVASFEGGGAAARGAAVAAVGGEWGEAVRGVPGTRVIELPAGTSVDEAVHTLGERAGVRWAEPDYIYETMAVPNDPLYPDLWGLQNVGQDVRGTTGVPGIDINAPAAWATTTGSPGVRVAIVDSGIAPEHPDLAANLDGALGRNFYSANPQEPADPAAWADLNMHGTHVAGTVAAVGDNALGVTGVSWRADLVADRVCGIGGTCTSVAIAQGLAYAGAIGAKVANASLGGPNHSYASEAAIAAYPETLYVVAAGNEAQNVDATPSYPCAYPQANIICVAALDSSGGLAGFSNYGREQVDLGAPGVDILSTAPNLETRFEGSGGLAKWTQEPGGRWEYDPEYETLDFVDTPKPLPASSSLTTAAPVDLTGVRDCRLSYGLRLDTFEERQRLFVEASTDGTEWVPVQQLAEGYGSSGGRTVPLTEDLRRFDGDESVWIRFRLQADSVAQNQDATVWIASPKVVCIAPMPAQGAYEYSSGTSMASPEVAGVAALAWSAHPEASVAEVRDAILASVVPTLSLATTTATGGRVDAAATLAALAKPAPQPPAPQPAPTPAPEQPSSSTPKASAPGWALAGAASRRIRVSTRGRAPLRIRCRAHATPRCRGRLVLLGRVRRGRHLSRHRIVLSARSYRLAAGRTRRRVAWLRPRPARLLRQGRIRRVRLVVRTVQPTGAKRRLRAHATAVRLLRRRGVQRG